MADPVYQNKQQSSTRTAASHQGSGRMLQDNRPVSQAVMQLKQRNAVFSDNLKSNTESSSSMSPGRVLQDNRPVSQAVKQLKENNTGLPDNLKSGIENLSGMSMDSVKVHYNSSKPAQLNALAYAQGTDIHVAPGQEKHLPHEAWHVVQQAQGRVKPTMQMKDGVSVNDDKGLEHEADVMGGKAVQTVQLVGQGNVGMLDLPPSIQLPDPASVIQRNAIKDDEGEDYHDSNYPAVRLRLQGESYPRKYSILNEGVYQGTIIVDDDGDYFYPDGDGNADYEKPFNLQVILAGAEEAVINEINIGQPGSGVLAGRVGNVTLRTAGLNSCVAWVLYNEQAAYMEHILVGDPKKVRMAGIQARINQVAAAFQANVGAAATNLHIHLDASHPAYSNSWPLWIGKLIPDGVNAETSMGAGSYAHTVPVSDNDRVLWRSDAISLEYDE